MATPGGLLPALLRQGGHPQQGGHVGEDGYLGKDGVVVVVRLRLVLLR